MHTGGETMTDGTVKYQESDSVYFIQSHFNDRKQIFLDPREWLAEYHAHNFRLAGPQIVIIDLAGHFVCGLICKIADAKSMFKDDKESVCMDVLSFIRKLFRSNNVNKSRGSPPVDESGLQNCLVIFNTTEWSYIDADNRAPPWVFDSFFPLEI